MDEADEFRWKDGRDGLPAPRIVTAPPPHDGIVHALRACFRSPSRLPEEWARLLGRLP